MSVNKLPVHKRVKILNMLVEGMSMRSISRVEEVSINTVTKLLVDAGEACAAYHDEKVHDVHVKRVQCDEIWSFCYSKQKNIEKAKSPPPGAGDVWTWTALDRDNKMILAWEVGDRSAETALEFIKDLRKRLANRVHLTTDGHKSYLEVVGETFGADIDFAQLVKLYGKSDQNYPERKYSPSVCKGAIKRKVIGQPSMKDICTSHVERQNLTMRMGMRRFTRLTNVFSKKLANHIHMLSLYFVHYNFVRIHKTIKMSPAMATGLANILYDMEWIVELIDKRARKPGPRGPYKKRISN